MIYEIYILMVEQGYEASWRDFLLRKFYGRIQLDRFNKYLENICFKFNLINYICRRNWTLKITNKYVCGLDTSPK